MVNFGCCPDEGGTMSAYPRGRRTRDDVLAVILRFLVAVVLATSLSYCSVAVEHAKALFT